MPNLKDLRTRKKAVQSTKKITSAMKLIAAAKLNKLHEKISIVRPYIRSLSALLEQVITDPGIENFNHPLLADGKNNNKHLIVLMTSNRGLCGGFNTLIVRQVQSMIRQDEANKKETFLLCIGQKGVEQLKKNHAEKILTIFDAYDKPLFMNAERIFEFIYDLYENKKFDHCTLVYNRFISALTQQTMAQPLMPYLYQRENRVSEISADAKVVLGEEKNQSISYDYEPNISDILRYLLPQYIKAQIYGALIENTTSEQGARMAAMDGATRNAETMIQELDLQYNRTRQAVITKELIEIISGAEAL